MSDDALIARQLVETLAAVVAGGSVLIAVARAVSRRRKAGALAAGPGGGEAEGAPADAPAVVKAPLWARLGTLIGLAFAAFVPAYFGPVTWTAAICLLVAMGLYEFWTMLDAYGAPPHRLAGWLAGLALPVSALVAGAAGLGPAMMAGFMLISVVALFSRQEAPLTGRLGGTALGMLYVGMLGAYLVLVGREGGFGGLVYFLMVVQLADVGGLMGGVLFGRHKLAPTLSPGKTWEGTATSFLAAAGAAWAFAFALPDVKVPILMGIAVLLAAAGLIGDLLASGLKRTAGLKDFGKALPGHGGVLDRFDGYLFAAPVYWAALLALQIPLFVP